MLSCMAFCYTALGHKLRFFRGWKAQFMTVGIIYSYFIWQTVAAVY